MAKLLISILSHNHLFESLQNTLAPVCLIEKTMVTLLCPATIPLLLNHISGLYMSKLLLDKVEFENVVLTGSTRFFRVSKLSKIKLQNFLLISFPNNVKIF